MNYDQTLVAHTVMTNANRTGGHAITGMLALPRGPVSRKGDRHGQRPDHP